MRMRIKAVKAKSIIYGFRPQGKKVQGADEMRDCWGEAGGCMVFGSSRLSTIDSGLPTVLITGEFQEYYEKVCDPN